MFLLTVPRHSAVTDAIHRFWLSTITSRGRLSNDTVYCNMMVVARLLILIIHFSDVPDDAIKQW